MECGHDHSRPVEENVTAHPYPAIRFVLEALTAGTCPLLFLPQDAQRYFINLFLRKVKNCTAAQSVPECVREGNEVAVTALNFHHFDIGVIR